MKSYAGIGSRETPGHIGKMMVEIAQFLEKQHVILRSGGATGADTFFESGVSTGEMKEIYLPWRGFNGNRSNRWSIPEPAFEIAKTYHGGFDRLSPGAQKLMARNTQQILGAELDDPVMFVICFTQDGCESRTTRNRLTGGTGQAIAIASDLSIPIVNLRNDNALDRIVALFEDLKI